MPTDGKRRRVVTDARREQNRLAQQSLRERKDKVRSQAIPRRGDN